MDYKLYILISVFFLFSCQKKVEKDTKIVEPEVVEETIIDKDSIFCDKIMTYILEESKNWPINYTFEKANKADLENRWRVDFDFQKDLLREAHYQTKDKKNPFSLIEVDYYTFNNEKTASQILADYKSALDCIDLKNFDEHIANTKVVGQSFFKLPTYLYRQGNTVFHIRADNGVVHIVVRALGKLKQEEKIDKNDIAP